MYDHEDQDEINDRFVSMAMHDYKDSIEQKVEEARVLEMKVQLALHNDQLELAAGLSGELFMLCAGIHLGDFANVITSFAHQLNVERSAGVEMHDLVMDHLARLQAYHTWMVQVGQPTQDLLMVTDMLACLREGLDSSAYGQANFNNLTDEEGGR